MNIEEANKIIAEYMGIRFLEPWDELAGWHDGKNYVEKPDFVSLDSLVPVWEKLNKEIFININRHDVLGYDLVWFDQLKNTDTDRVEGESSIQEISCMATAKAIQELNK